MSGAAASGRERETPVTTDPGAIWRVIHGYTGYWSAVAAVRLGLFDALAAAAASPGDHAPGDDAPADTGLDAGELARRCAAGPDAVQVIADALTAIGLLQHDGGRYRLSPAADAHLVRGRPAPMAELLLWSPGPVVNWPALACTAQGTAPPSPVEDDAADFYAHLVDATFGSQLGVARAVLVSLDIVPGARILELGAGRGPWTSALLSADPTASAVLNDLPGVIERGAGPLGPEAGRCTFVAGDYLTASLPDGAFDVVVLGHVLRAEPDERARRLVARGAGLLAPGGRMIVTEYLAGRDPTTHPQPALLAATMLAATRHGRVVTAEVVEGWLAAAGCAVVARPGPVANTDVLVAARDPLAAPSEGAP